MKIANVSKGLLLGLSLLLATSVFAASNKGSLQTMSPVTVNGTTLPAGDYQLKWEGTGSNVQLNILKGNKVVATTPARLVDTNQSPNGNQAVLKGNNDGTQSLSEVRFGGKKYELQIGEQTADEAAGSTK
jgi:hypothetical protein